MIGTTQLNLGLRFWPMWLYVTFSKVFNLSKVFNFVLDVPWRNGTRRFSKYNALERVALALQPFHSRKSAKEYIKAVVMTQHWPHFQSKQAQFSTTIAHNLISSSGEPSDFLLVSLDTRHVCTDVTQAKYLYTLKICDFELIAIPIFNSFLFFSYY